jgi:hypothetical protein
VQARESIVTPQTPQIQELIRQIDEALRKSSPRLPWLQSAEVAHQRQVLQQTRSYLVGLQQQAREAEERPLTGSKPQPFPESSAETAQQVLQAVLQEMNYLRTNMLQPLRSDIDTLQHRRDLLAQEIQQLEAQKQQALPPANSQVVTEFLQSSMQQLQDNLTGQVAHMLAGLSAGEQPLLGSSDSLTPAQRLQHMQQIQNQSDQLMMRLDSAIRIIFESMQTNIQSYEDSLEQGLNRMHTLGQQGEAMFSALVNRLAEHLGRETSTYLQSSIQVDTPTSGFLQESQTEIDQLLGELNALDDALEQADTAPEFDEFDPTIDPLAFLSTPPDISDEEITLFQHDFEDDEITRFQDGSELEPIAPTPDLSSAMDLLNQLNGDDPEPDREEAVLDNAIANDEFYQSLFGEAQKEAEEVPEAIPESIPEPISESVSDSIPESIPEAGSDWISESVSESIADEGSERATSPDMSDLFFSGMGDPSTLEEEAESETPDYPAADLSQSVESFLLRAPDPAPPAEAVETINSLADLLGSPEETIAQPTADQNLDENSYEPARAEENLLAQDDAQRVMLDPDSLSIDARQLLESDLSALENVAELTADTAEADMTLFDQDQTDLPFPTDDSGDRAGLALDGFDFADETPSASGLTLDGLELDAPTAPKSDVSSDFDSPTAPDPSDVPADSIPTHAMSHESSTPFAPDSNAFNAFSFEGLDDELFEPTPESKPLEPETLLKKKRPRSKGEPGRGFGR